MWRICAKLLSRDFGKSSEAARHSIRDTYGGSENSILLQRYTTRSQIIRLYASIKMRPMCLLAKRRCILYCPHRSQINGCCTWLICKCSSTREAKLCYFSAHTCCTWTSFARWSICGTFLTRERPLLTVISTRFRKRQALSVDQFSIWVLAPALADTTGRRSVSVLQACPGAQALTNSRTACTIIHTRTINCTIQTNGSVARFACSHLLLEH